MKLIQQINEAAKTHLSADQMGRIVDSMHDMISGGDVEDPYEAAHMNLENIAGFETAADDVKEKVIGHLITLYNQKYK